MSHDLIKYRGRHSPKDLLKFEGCCPGMGTQYCGPKNLRRIMVVGIPQPKDVKSFYTKAYFISGSTFSMWKVPFNSWKDLACREVFSNIKKENLAIFFLSSLEHFHWHALKPLAMGNCICWRQSTWNMTPPMMKDGILLWGPMKFHIGPHNLV